LCSKNRKSLDIISLPVKNVGHEVNPVEGQAHIHSLEYFASTINNNNNVYLVLLEGTVVLPLNGCLHESPTKTNAKSIGQPSV
jgi:hypothetical protein